jgi:membrane protein implicated in regulation of membrane protease activity
VSDWLIWVIVAVVLAVGEIATPGLFVLGPVALAALLALLVAALGGPMLLQLIVFGVASIASLALLRPVARRHLRMPAQLRTGRTRSWAHVRRCSSASTSTAAG